MPGAVKLLKVNGYLRHPVTSFRSDTLILTLFVVTIRLKVKLRYECHVYS